MYSLAYLIKTGPVLHPVLIQFHCLSFLGSFWEGGCVECCLVDSSFVSMDGRKLYSKVGMHGEEDYVDLSCSSLYLLIAM